MTTGIIAPKWRFPGRPVCIRSAHPVWLATQIDPGHILSNYRQTVQTMGLSSIDYTVTEAALNTTGLLFKLYPDYFGAVPVQVDGN